MPQRISGRAAASLAALAVTAGGIAALATAAQAATVADGPIAYTNGTQWSEVNADSTGRHTVTPTGGGFVATDPVVDVAFSPDGSWAAFTDLRNTTLWVSWADGTHARQVTPVPDPNTPYGDSGPLEPAWSPDSKTIVFQYGANLDGNTELWTVPSDGSAAPTQLTSSADDCWSSDASWAPDGDIAYSEYCSNADPASPTSVKIIDPATKSVKQTIPGFYRPRFSPDGTKLVAVSRTTTASNGVVYVMAADGSGSTALTPTVASHCAAGTGLAWSPDGSRIAYAQCTYLPDSSEQLAVYVQPVAPGGTATAVVPPTTAQAGQPYIDWPRPFTPPTSQNPGRPDPSQPPAAGRPYTLRLGGSDRIGTSIAVADAAYGPAAPAKAKVAVLTRADNYADALAGNALAAQKGGPLLLTGSAKLDPAVGAELGKLLPKGSTVYILGGTGAVSPQVDAAVRALGLTPKRLAGSDRFQTATRIAAEISPRPHTVLVATGTDAPDALAAGAAAATDPNGGVVLLSDGKALPASTKAYLAGVNPATTKVYGVGVQGVTALTTLPGFAGHVTPLEGPDRYATDAAVANDPTLYPHPAQAALATGWTWPDALSGGAYAGALHAPLLLTDGPVLPDGAGSWLHAHGAALTFLPVFGGPNAVPDSAVRQAGDQAWGAGQFDLR